MDKKDVEKAVNALAEAKRKGVFQETLASFKKGELPKQKD